MKFTKLRLNGLSVVDLPIIGALPSDVYICKGVDGLGPPEVDVSIADTLNAGGIYQGRRPQSREIVALVGLNPDYTEGETVSDLRTSLYGMLTPGYQDSITVEIVDDETVIATTTGYVRRMEINPFSKEPEVQVTIACLEQYLQGPLVIFVEPESMYAPEIDNVGTAPAGFHMEVIFTSDVTNWELTGSGTAKMLFNYAFLTGDKLEIDTRPGHRGIWVTRAGIRKNVIWILSSDSIWLMLHGGLNSFDASSPAYTWGDVYFLPQYWGI